MTLPIPTIEFAWGADLDADPSTWTWTDESSRRLAQIIPMSKGRSDESSATTAGTLTFQLDNYDGRYTPGNPMSPIWPHVDRGTPCRLKIPGVTAPRFIGQIEEVALSWPWGDISAPDPAVYPGESRVDITVAGVLRRLNRSKTARQSTLRHALNRLTGVVAWWTFEDDSGAGQIASGLPDGRPMRISGDYSAGQTDPLLPGAASVVTIGSGQNSYMAGVIPRIPQVPGVTWTVTRLFRIDTPATDPASTRLMAVDTNGRVATWRLSINDTGLFISGRDIDDAAVVSTSIAASSWWWGNWDQLILDVTDDGANVDWQVILRSGSGLSVISNTFVGDTGVPYSFRNSCIGPPSGISLSHLVVTSGASLPIFSPSQLSAWAGETAAHRFWRLCNEEGVPVVIVGDTTMATSTLGDPAFSEPLGPQGLRTFVELLNECVDVDHGILYELPDKLGLGYRCHRTMQNQAAQLALDAAVNDVANPFSPVIDDQRIRNDVEVRRPGGSSVRLTTDPPPKPLDLYDAEIELNVPSDGHLSGHASWLLWVGGHYRRVRYPSVTVALDINDALLTPWVGLELGDRVTVTNLPPQHQTAIDVIVESYAERIGPAVWRAELTCSAADIWEVGIRNDNARGKRDTDGSELGQAIDTDDTLWSVATTKGRPWTTSSSEAPFDWWVGGERVTVTAVAGASSPQLVTVTRSVNGVVKSHPAGTKIRLWRPTVRGF